MKKKAKKLGIGTSLSGKPTVNKENPLPPRRVPIFTRELIVLKCSILKLIIMFAFIVESKFKRIIHLLLVLNGIHRIYTVISSHMLVEQK